MKDLNRAAGRLARELCAEAERCRVTVQTRPSGSCVVDCGVQAAGGLAAGIRVAEICLGGRGQVSLVPAPHLPGCGLAVAVRSDDPVAGCLASQYAGWQVQAPSYFAMASGPMRAAAAREPLFQQLGYQEPADEAVGVLESSSLPSDEVCCQLAEKCGVGPARLTLLVARTASLAGTLQVVARSLETALHKMHELGMDLRTIVSGCGTAPLPAPGKDDLESMGRTNDAVLYGGDVTLWLSGNDEQLSQEGARIPSCASRDFGRPFRELFQKYGGDFYQIDPLLFSPARVRLVNLATGKTHLFGQLRTDLLELSF